MKHKKETKVLKYVSMILFLMVFFWGMGTVSAFTLGKTYDKTNYQEIETLLAPAFLVSMKNGDYIMKTGKLDFEMKIYKKYQDMCNKNEELFDIDEKGILIEKKTGKPPAFVMGNPFPKIDMKDPKAGEKIAENFAFNIRYRNGTSSSLANSNWVGRTRIERTLTSLSSSLPYQNRFKGPIPNPNNFLFQNITGVVEPMNLRGSFSMNWSYNDAREDTAFAYIPMLRRVRRTSASTRSDPYMGGDSCTDDTFGYAGKNAAMKFKFVGEKRILVPFTSDKIVRSTELPDGSLLRTFPSQRPGAMVPGWKGAAYCPADVLWVERPVYVVEMFPKDPYYNYGRQILYIDRDQYCIYLKEIYDRSGLYWKKTLVPSCYHITQSGRDWLMTDLYIATDDRARHSSFSITRSHAPGKSNYELPLTTIGPDYFTEANLVQLSK